MAWSYRQDRSDETYHEPGVALVEGKKVPHTPRDSEHAEELMKGEKTKMEKDARMTEHQEFPGQNVPRFVKESDEEKKAREEAEKDKGRLLVPDPKETSDAIETAKQQKLDSERQRIRLEEQQRVQNDELEKEREKIRKEEADKLKKETGTSHAAANKK